MFSWGYLLQSWAGGKKTGKIYGATVVSSCSGVGPGGKSRPVTTYSRVYSHLAGMSTAARRLATALTTNLLTCPATLQACHRTPFTYDGGSSLWHHEA